MSDTSWDGLVGEDAISFLMDVISENILNEELNKLLLVKIQFREHYY